MIRYYVSYAFQNHSGALGFATCEMPLTNPIRSLADTRMIRDWISDHNTEIFNVSVLSFSRFDDDPAGGQTR
jgi:hypothetical protein